MNKRKSTNWVYALIGGIFFGLITVVEVLLFTLADEQPPWIVIPMLGIFQAVGILFSVFFVRGVYRTSKEREVAMMGSEATAELISCNTNTSINGVSYYFAMFRFAGSEGYVTYKTQSYYTEAEAEYLTSLKTFSIKYYGKYAVITEDLSRAGVYVAKQQPQTPPVTDVQERRDSAHRLPDLILTLSQLPDAAAMDALLRTEYGRLDAEAFMTLVKTRDTILQSRATANSETRRYR